MDVRLQGLVGDSAMLSIHKMSPESRISVPTHSVNDIIPGDLEGSGISVDHLLGKSLTDISLVANA